MVDENSTLKKKVETEVFEEETNVFKLVETLITSFLKSDSNYGALTDLKVDIDRIYNLVKNHISNEKLDIYALKLDDRILLSKTNLDFENLCKVIKEKSHLLIGENMIEIWEDNKNRIIHLLIIPFRKHFPIEYINDLEKENTIMKISSMRW
jgi:hypothetical protein